MRFKKIKHFKSPGCVHELTFSCFKKQNFFFNERFCYWFIENLDKCRNCGLFKIISYVIMPNHVHLSILPEHVNYNISKNLGSIKIPITRKILNNNDDFPNDLFLRMRDEAQSKTIYRFWQRGGGYDRNLYSKKAIIASINYMHDNPIRRGLVDSAENWKWSSAGFYAGKENYILRMDNDVLQGFI